MSDSKANNTEPVLDEAMQNALAEALKPIPLASDRQAAIKSALMARIKDSPAAALSVPAPAGSYTVRANEGEWLPLTDLIERKVVYRDLASGIETALWRVQPKAQIPMHRHTEVEECLVLQGEVMFGEHILQAGDFHVATVGCEHPDACSVQGALLLIRGPIPADANATDSE